MAGKRLPAKERILGGELFVKEATEPTNIIWENRHFTSAQRFRRAIHASLLIALLLLISFAIIKKNKKKTNNKMLKYSTLNCSVII